MLGIVFILPYLLQLLRIDLLHWEILKHFNGTMSSPTSASHTKNEGRYLLRDLLLLYSFANPF